MSSLMAFGEKKVLKTDIFWVRETGSNGSRRDCMCSLRN